MPVFESADHHHITPKSILRYRPIGEDGTAHGMGGSPPIILLKQRASRPPTHHAIAHDVPPEGKRATTTKEARWPHGGRSSPAPGGTRPSRRGQRPFIPVSLSQRPKSWFQRQVHPLLVLGLGMVVMLMLGILLSAVLDWARMALDDLDYGRPRTYQVDAWVGHHEQTGLPSHFIVLNLRGQIDIIEIAGGDPTQTHIYTGPHLSGAHDEMIPVTIRFVTPVGKTYPNMIVFFGGSEIIYLNVGGTFVPQEKGAHSSSSSIYEVPRLRSLSEEVSLETTSW